MVDGSGATVVGVVLTMEERRREATIIFKTRLMNNFSNWANCGNYDGMVLEKFMLGHPHKSTSLLWLIVSGCLLT